MDGRGRGQLTVFGIIRLVAIFGLGGSFLTSLAISLTYTTKTCMISTLFENSLAEIWLGALDSERVSVSSSCSGAFCGFLDLIYLVSYLAPSKVSAGDGLICFS